MSAQKDDSNLLNAAILGFAVAGIYASYLTQVIRSSHITHFSATSHPRPPPEPCLTHPHQNSPSRLSHKAMPYIAGRATRGAFHEAFWSWSGPLPVPGDAERGAKPRVLPMGGGAACCLSWEARRTSSARVCVPKASSHQQHRAGMRLHGPQKHQLSSPGECVGCECLVTAAAVLLMAGMPKRPC